MTPAITTAIINLVEGLTPATGPTRFVLQRGDLDENARARTVDREFDLRWDSDPVRIFETGTRRYRAAGTIGIRYDSGSVTTVGDRAADLEALEQRMAEDAIQIVTAMESAAIPCAVLIQFTGGSSIDRSEPEFPILRLRFSVDFRVG